MDEKQKLLKLKSEVNEAITHLTSAINHLRDYNENFDAHIQNLEVTELKEELRKREKRQ